MNGAREREEAVADASSVMSARCLFYRDLLKFDQDSLLAFLLLWIGGESPVERRRACARSDAALLPLPAIARPWPSSDSLRRRPR